MRVLPRLCDAQLAQLPKNIARPHYNRREVTSGIVHLGVGAFHRAHQAVYLDDILQKGESGWGITGISLRRPDMRDALQAQDYLYSMTMRDGEQDQPRIIGSLVKMLVAPEDPQAVVAALADPATKIISLTITEKGYCYAPATASLDENHSDILHDSKNLENPRSALGFLVAAIKRRVELKLPPVTLLSCDNLPANGETLRRVILRFAEIVAPELVDYIAHSIAFPSTMVDRIVPATRGEDKILANALLGCEDKWPVMTEPFSQWVVENHFAGPRPPLEEVGVELVGDVAPFELMKLRLLNGSHSTLAYLGYLAGYDSVSEVMQAPYFAQFIHQMMDEEITPTLPFLTGFDLRNYKDALIERFKNPALKHRTWQIAMDGSQKIPQRLLGTIRAQLQAGKNIDHLLLGLAGWLRYASGKDEKGANIDVRDPQAQILHACSAEKTSIQDICDAYLQLSDIFGTDLPRNPSFVAALRHTLAKLFDKGAAYCVCEIASHKKL